VTLDPARIDLAVHEAGHAVTGVVHGGVLRTAIVSSSRVYGLSGLTQFRDLAAAERGTTALAGPWAEKRFRTKTAPRSSGLTYGSVCTGDDASLIAAAEGGLPHVWRVVPLIDRLWPAVGRIAVQLYQQSEIGHNDVLVCPAGNSLNIFGE
jgi:hypothetical protein